MNPDAFAALIPVVGLGGLFAWLIARTVTKAATARLEAQGRMRMIDASLIAGRQ